MLIAYLNKITEEGEHSMPYGYTGKILHVDLSHRKIEIEEQDEAFYRSYLGGRGIGYHYLLKKVPAGIDPLAPENILVLAPATTRQYPQPRRPRSPPSTSQGSPSSSPSTPTVDQTRGPRSGASPRAQGPG